MAGQPFLQPGQLSQQGVVLQTQQPGQWVTRSGLQQPQQFQQIQAGQVQHAFPPGEAPYGQVPMAYTPQVQQEIGGQLGQFATTGTFGIPQHVQFSIQRKGPKNYARSDERMREVICECLIQDMTLDVSDVTIEVQKGCVSLNGTVPTRHMKYCIEDIVDKCWGVQEIENDLHVRPCDEPGMSTGATGHMSMQSGGGFAGASTASPTSRSSGADLRARDKEM
jgi:osmotically-inducible protein OsmY